MAEMTTLGGLMYDHSGRTPLDDVSTPELEQP
jgi:hypothetical protein